jgi:hypothetical protein
MGPARQRPQYANELQQRLPDVEGLDYFATPWASAGCWAARRKNGCGLSGCGRNKLAAGLVLAIRSGQMRFHICETN